MTIAVDLGRKATKQTNKLEEKAAHCRQMFSERIKQILFSPLSVSQEGTIGYLCASVLLTVHQPSQI